MTETLEKPKLRPRQVKLIKASATLHAFSDMLLLDVKAGESSDLWREHLAGELKRVSVEIGKLADDVT